MSIGIKLLSLPVSNLHSTSALFFPTACFLFYWSFIEKTSVKQSIKQQVCSNFQMMCTDQMYPPVLTSGGQEQSYKRTALHVICSFRVKLLKR